jgi:small-conductance mechanosensitive channel
MVRRTPSLGASLGAWLSLLVAIAVLFTGRGAHADAAPHAPLGLPTGLVVDATIDRTTPRRALTSFLEAARAGDFGAAAHCFDLRGRPDASSGPELAEELSYVLYRRAPIDLNTVPDDAAHDGQVVVDTFTVGEQDAPLVLVRVKFDDGIQRWVFSRATVKRIPDIAATVRTAVWEQKLPRALRRPVVLGNAPWQWVGIALGVLVAYVLGRALAALVVRVAVSFAKRTALVRDETLLATKRPLRTILASTLFAGAIYVLGVSLVVSRVLSHVAYTGFVVGIAWLLLAAFSSATDALSPIANRSDDVPRDRARERTRRALLERLASAAIIGVTVAILLLQFDVVRHVGLSLLASAGIAGVVLGLAAQKSLAGVIAGIQLSITQPIRLGDTIFIEGEIGIVQDIFLTYAVIRLWDDRCVVVPLARFLDSPFQNWTLLTHDLTGVVLLHVKFTAPIGRLRERARELCAVHPKWDGNRCELHVGDSDMFGLILRVTLSAKNPADAWELRCAVREGLVDFLKTIDNGAHLG